MKKWFSATLILLLLPIVTNAQSDATFRAMNQPIKPYHIIGNVYYVGATEVSSFLITTSEGHILLDSGFAETVPIIQENLKQLGFKLQDVKILLNNHAHFDHAGGLAELKELTGAQLVVSEADAELLAAGGKGDFFFGDQYPYRPVKADRILKDRDEIKLGDVVMTAHLTPGHTKGCTTWTMKVYEAGKELDVIFVGSVSIPGYTLLNNPKYPNMAEDYARSFTLLKSLPCDVFLAPHGSFFSMKEKMLRLAKGEKPNPFIDPQGYRSALERSEQVYREQLQKEKQSQGSTSTAVNPCTSWPATDALGRKVSIPDEVGPPKPDRCVGIFYFLWHNQHEGKSPNWDGPYDVSKIFAKDPDALKKPDSPLWGPIGMYHYWGEPLYGYYFSTDAWVLRRHAQLLADAGIDVLIFDTTNAVTYPEVYTKLCEVFTLVRQEGGRTPQIAFMVNTQAGETAQQLYDDLYKKGRYRELWFYWQGKPLMICDPEKAGPEVKQFFTLRRAHWPFTMVDTPYAWHWEADYPQPYGYTDDPKKPEQVNVSIAQNLRQSDGKVTNMSVGDARGRSFHDGQLDPAPGAINQGFNFAEQWKRAFELQPPFVMVTGWNEWIAGRFGEPGGPIIFVDQFSEEFSRDIEPMKGGHGDNYYWQLVSNVRRFKGAPELPKASAPTTIRIEGGFEPWRAVSPEFQDHVGETIPRDFSGSAGLHYTNRTGRNDLVAFKVAREDKNVYFYAKTREALTPSSDPNWMWLLINTDRNTETGWEGYDFIVNRTVDTDGKTWLEKNEGGWNWKKVMLVNYRVQGNELHLAVPRSALESIKGANNGTLGTPNPSFDFKWADNIQHPGDIMDFYLSGDVAPEGRFMYRYEGKD